MVMYMFIETEMGQQQISTHTENGGNQCPPTLWTAEREGLKFCSKIQVRSSLVWDTRKYSCTTSRIDSGCYWSCSLLILFSSCTCSLVIWTVIKHLGFGSSKVFGDFDR